ncbi:MAG: OmpA family protein [Bacteroidales bacterium]|jgi:outer membrane protein OmpA-like peptidoglycan-associated protein/tetratricopeptide (TPR) repeat protein|nr:OmpA family protein [Bacteroidales bacterium]
MLFLGLPLYAQENPKINKQEFSLSKDNKKDLKKAEKYYKKGLYDAAMEQYMKLYRLKSDYSPLNYKIGVSNLYGVNPQNALTYFNQTDPEAVVDYYCQKGIALVYNHKYADAKDAFNQYLQSLTSRKRKKETAKINRFIDICDFSEKAIRDSVPVFVSNLGPGVNSYYDDYSAVAVQEPSKGLFFTSRRPKDDAQDLADRSEHQERIWYSVNFSDGHASEAIPATVTSVSRHLSVAGVNQNDSNLQYYKGKTRFGDLYRVEFKETGETKRDRRLSSKISKKSSKEGSISFDDSGDAYFISDRLGGKGGRDIWYAPKKSKNKYKRPINLKSINTPLSEESVYVSPDGNTLYFSSNGYPGMGGFDIYKSRKDENGVWGEPVNLGYPINGHDDDLFYRVTPDSTIILFSSKRPGGFGGLDLYVIKKDLRIPFELFGDVTDLETGVQIPATVRLHSKEDETIVGFAENDIQKQRYSIKMETGGGCEFTVQIEAPGYKVATKEIEAPNKRHSKIERNYVLEKLLHPFTLSGYVTNLKTGKPVYAEVLLKKEDTDSVLYRTVSNEQSGFYTITLEDKINVALTATATDYFDHTESLQLKNIRESESSKNITMQKSTSAYVLTGVITEEQTHNPLKASIKVNKPGQQVTQTVESGEDGKYELSVVDEGPFLLEVTSEGYFFVNSVLQFTADSTLLLRNFELKKLESGAKVVIQNILFKTGSSILMPESFTELNKVVNLLKENPKVRIEISGHTDNTGSAALNKKLSKNRALSVKNYLSSQGISGDRIEFEGYGFDRPIESNSTEAGRAANRRVELEILN